MRTYATLVSVLAMAIQFGAPSPMSAGELVCVSSHTGGPIQAPEFLSVVGAGAVASISTGYELRVTGWGWGPPERGQRPEV